jgi:hypothetical protein
MIGCPEGRARLYSLPDGIRSHACTSPAPCRLSERSPRCALSQGTWIEKLNIAGSRDSEESGVGEFVRAVLDKAAA